MAANLDLFSIHLHRQPNANTKLDLRSRKYIFLEIRQVSHYRNIFHKGYVTNELLRVHAREIRIIGQVLLPLSCHLLRTNQRNSRTQDFLDEETGDLCQDYSSSLK